MAHIQMYHNPPLLFTGSPSVHLMTMYCQWPVKNWEALQALYGRNQMFPIETWVIATVIHCMEGSLRKQFTPLWERHWSKQPSIYYDANWLDADGVRRDISAATTYSSKHCHFSTVATSMAISQQALSHHPTDATACKMWYRAAVFVTLFTY